MAGTTTNFGFDYPTSTDYVKDGATAIQTLADDVDARFGDDANYPDQIVNVVSGVSLPLPFAIAAGIHTVTSSLSITFPASRFTQAPIIVTNLYSTANAVSVTTSTPTTSGVTLYTWNASNTPAGNARPVGYVAVQMTSASSAGQENIMIYIVTCHTTGCENENIGIEFVDPADTVICGPCGQEITDKVEVVPEAPAPKATKGK